MHKCDRCGGRLRRVHRTFVERIGYMAVYRCRNCQDAQVIPRPWRFHFGPGVRCPECGTTRVTKLRMPDRIDPMQTGLLNLLERLMNGKLYHCRFCRIQFFDRRSPPRVVEPETESPAEAEPAQSRGLTT